MIGLVAATSGVRVMVWNAQLVAVQLVPMVPEGCAKFGWLKKLKTSKRNSPENRSVIFCRLTTDASACQKGRPWNWFLLELPKVPSAGGVSTEPPCTQQPKARRVANEAASLTQVGLLTAISAAVKT